MAGHPLGQFKDGIASWRRALAKASPDNQPVVFSNAVAEVSGYVRKGLDRAAAVDELTEMAASIGFGDTDQVQSTIAATFARIEHDVATAVDWSTYEGDENDEKLGLVDSSAAYSDAVAEPLRTPAEKAARKRNKAAGNGQGYTSGLLTQQTLGAFLEALRPPDYLIDGLLQRRFIYSLTGKTGTGKTAIAIYVATCVALGRAIADMDVVQGNVLYLAGENPDDIGYRWIALRQRMDCEHIELPVTICAERFKISERIAELEEMARAVGGYALVIVDTSAAYFEGDDVNSNTQQGDHARMLRALTRLHGGPCVLVCTHPVKRAQADDLIPLGGGAFLNEMDGNLTVQLDGPAIELSWQGKFRGPDFAPVNFELIKDVTHPRLKTASGRLFRTAIATPLSDASKEAMEEAAIGDVDLLLREVAKRPGGSQADYARALGWIMPGSGKPYRSKAQRIIDKAAKAKFLSRELGRLAITEKGKKRL